MPPFDAAALISSFQAAGAWIDESSMGIVPSEGMGWGAVAKQRIEVSGVSLACVWIAETSSDRRIRVVDRRECDRPIR
jgi:hypothetical protein